MHHIFQRLRFLLLLGTLGLGLAACGNKDGKAIATQVAAKVGSDEISVHQINQVLSRTNAAGATPEATQAMSREVLEKLIDQQLAIGKAIENKLDRTPDAVAAIEAARRDILARAYLQKIASAQPKPTPAEAHSYYAEHPQLFSARHIFNIQELVVPAAPKLAEQLRAFASGGKSPDDVATWLKSNGSKFGGGAATRAAEQIPLDILPKVHALKAGQSVVLETPQAITFLYLVSSQAAPVDEAAALPRIEQFLGNQRATEAIAADIKQLRSATTITYMGEFAGAATATASSAAPAPAAAVDKTQSVLEKGVAGLK